MTEQDRRLRALRHTPQYDPECSFLWKTCVPDAGQSTVLQAELLRRIEKLRWEAQENGNRNWDEQFDFFCDFVQVCLCRLPYYSEEEKQLYTRILAHFQDCGRYAATWYDNDCPLDGWDVERVACVEDDLYDVLTDAVGRFQKLHPEPVPFEPDPDLYR